MSGRSSSTSALGKSVLGIAERASGITAMLISLAVLGILAIAALTVGWQRWGRTVVARPIYRISAENIRATPVPPWIKSDVRAEVVRDWGLAELSIFDKDVTIRVYQAFELHPWVAKVKRVSKHPPARLDVDLEYRRPVAWVQVPAGLISGNEAGVLPVDADSIVLPTGDFSLANVEDYLLITIPGVSPCGLAGAPWGDPRVAGAARIAALLADEWQAWGLYRIRLMPESQGDRTRPAVYVLETRGQRQIVWGLAPGIDAPDEPSAATKLRRLQKLAESIENFDQAPAGEWDLRRS